MRFLIQSIHLVFLTYTIFLFIRVVGSWFPTFSRTKYMRFVAHYTDPYLNLFRKFLPPIGGVLDLSPLLGFFTLQISENIILSLLS